jgi:hypothetical protein
MSEDGDMAKTMTSLHPDFKLVASDTWNITGVLRDIDGTALDVSGAVLEWLLVDPDGVVARSFPGLAEVTVQGLGAITISLAADATDLPPGRYTDALRVRARACNLGWHYLYEAWQLLKCPYLVAREPVSM